MAYLDATLAEGGTRTRPSRDVAASFAAVLPALLMSYALVIGPLLFAAETRAVLSKFGDPTNGASSLAAAVVYPFFFLLAVLTLLIARPSITRAALQLSVALALLCLYAFATTLWSLDPGRTLAKAAQQTMICVSLAAAVLSARDPQRVLDWIKWLMVVVVLVNLMAVLSRPPGPIGHEGIYDHKNSLGAVMALALLFGLYSFTRRRLVSLVVGAFLVAGSLMLLVASESKTSAGIAVLAPSLSIVLYVLAKHVRVPLLVSWLVIQFVIVAGFLVIGTVLDFQLSDVLTLAFGDETLTGRTHIWAFAVEQIAERPLLGYGYHGFWNIGPESPRFTAHIQFIHNMPHAHNGYLDLLINLGLVGLILFAVVFVLSFGRLMRLERAGVALCIFAIANLVCVSMRVYLESEWFIDASAPSETMLLLFGFLAAMAPAVRRSPLPAPKILR
jgi:exopolysaccharide production protein ExoQ